MRLFISSLLLGMASIASAASIPMMEFPLMNGTPGQTYKMSDVKNGVFVFEAFRLSCSYCNTNAPNVDQLADEYRDNARVQVIDLGLDQGDFEYSEWNRIHNPNHPVVKDVGFKAYSALKTQNLIPQVFIVNCRGERVGVHAGTWDNAANAQIRQHIATALATTCEVSGN